MNTYQEFFILISYYIFKIKCIHISGLLIYLELEIKRSFFRIIKRFMTVYLFIYLGFTVSIAKEFALKKISFKDVPGAVEILHILDYSSRKIFMI